MSLNIIDNQLTHTVSCILLYYKILYLNRACEKNDYSLLTIFLEHDYRIKKEDVDKEKIKEEGKYTFPLFRQESI